MNIVISGASRGIGKAIAKKMVHQGHHVCINARNLNDLKTAKKEIEKGLGAIHIYQCNVEYKNEIKSFAQFALEKLKRIDILINNAGFFLPSSVHNEADGILEKMLTINLFSAYHLSREIIPNMVKNKSGLIVNISSVAGLQAYTGGGAYSIAKFALTGFSKNLRIELMEKGIKVSTIYPGATYTDSWKESDINADRIMQANDIAETIIMLSKLSPQAVAEEIILRPLLGDL